MILLSQTIIDQIVTIINNLHSKETIFTNERNNLKPNMTSFMSCYEATKF
jgi:hypothetical protein